jgi:hypothetical protein
MTLRKCLQQVDGALVSGQVSHRGCEDSMADQVIDRLVSSLASGLMGTDEFIEAVEGQARVMRPANAGAAATSLPVATVPTAEQRAPQS